MAEDPSTWGPVERVIDDAMERNHKNAILGLIGLSVVRVIADALRDHGLIDTEMEAAIKHQEEHHG